MLSLELVRFCCSKSFTSLNSARTAGGMSATTHLRVYKQGRKCLRALCLATCVHQCVCVCVFVCVCVCVCWYEEHRKQWTAFSASSSSRRRVRRRFTISSITLPRVERLSEHTRGSTCVVPRCVLASIPRSQAIAHYKPTFMLRHAGLECAGDDAHSSIRVQSTPHVTRVHHM